VGGGGHSGINIDSMWSSSGPEWLQKKRNLHCRRWLSSTETSREGPELMGDCQCQHPAVRSSSKSLGWSGRGGWGCSQQRQMERGHERLMG
jgi:hypothetical protein